MKDNGSNTNVVSRQFVEKFRHKLNIQKCNFVSKHSAKPEESPTGVDLDTELQIDRNIYMSSLAGVNAQHDILVGIP